MDPILALFLVFFVVHFVADFPLQVYFKDGMGRKHEEPSHLLTHGMMYTGVLCLTAALVSVILTEEQFLSLWPTFWTYLAFVLINGASHIIIDYFTSNAAHGFLGKGRTDHAVLTLGLDQMLHMLVFVFSVWLVML